MTVGVRDATEADFELVAGDVRQADRAEWSAGTGMLFGDAVRSCMRGPDFKRVALDATGTPLCFWGCDPEGRVWLFATIRAERLAISLHRVLKPNLDELHARFGRLEAWADARNEVHHKWLIWLGFEQDRVVPVGPFGLPFIIFFKEQ